MSDRAAQILDASPAVEVDVRAGISADELKTAIHDYDGLLVRSRTKVTEEVINAASRLRIVGRAGIGVDNIDLTAASRKGILVENAPSGNSVTTAEHAICLLLSLARHIPQATASMKASKWEKKKFEGRELLGKTLGIIGLGNIGRIVASRAQGLQMRVVGYDPFISKDAAERIGVGLLSLDELFANSDFLTVHTPLTDETRGIIGKKAFSLMKPGVLLVNAARGGVVDEVALLEALESGKVAGAALDVFSKEPPPEKDPLVQHSRVICTPHLGASTSEAQDKVAEEVAEQLVVYAERGEVRNAINVARMSHEAREQLAPWLDLSSRLGALLGQLARSTGDETGFIDDLTVEVIGEPAQAGTAASTNAALIGLMGSYMDVPINEVNAPIVAKERGITISEVTRHQDRDFASAISLTCSAGGSKRSVRGTLYHVGNRVVPRIVQIDGFLVEADPQGTLLAVRNQDRPGVIGAVGTLLGEREINVHRLHVGVDNQQSGAIALWNIEDKLSDELLAEIRKLPMIESAQIIRL